MKSRAAREPKPLRADAERNRRRVLDVAQAVFAAEGLAVPIDAIARRAGLGVGTLYRHFPTKEALFEAIVVERMTALVDEVRALLDAEDAGDAFFSALGRVTEEGGRKKHFIEALGRARLDTTRTIGALKEELHATLAKLLKRAQRAKVVRRDVDEREVMALAMGTVAALERLGLGERAKERVMAIVRDGLRG